MSWRENLKVGKLHAEEFHLGTANAGQGTQVTATPAELNLVDNMWNSVSTTATPASGSCGVQFVFKDAAGTTMATAVTGIFYISSLATGLDFNHTNLTGLAVLTNGKINPSWYNAGSAYVNAPVPFITTAAGLLGITITGSIDDYYVVFQHPTGKLVVSDVCTVNA